MRKLSESDYQRGLMLSRSKPPYGPSQIAEDLECSVAQAYAIREGEPLAHVNDLAGLKKYKEWLKTNRSAKKKGQSGEELFDDEKIELESIRKAA